MLAWTPPESQGYLGSVLLQDQPKKALSPSQYESALARRINRMVKKEKPERALELLQASAANENLVVSDKSQLANVGDLLVENSEWLRERAAFPNQPVPAPLKPEPETLQALKHDSLETFLSVLYRDSA